MTSKVLRHSFYSLSVLLVLILPFIPHHHHEGVRCMTVEFCTQDGRANDEHTTHHSNDDLHDTSFCIKHLQSLEAQREDSNSPLHFDITPYWNGLLTPKASAPLRFEADAPASVSFAYVSPTKRGFNSLRAPPFTF